MSMRNWFVCCSVIWLYCRVSEECDSLCCVVCCVVCFSNVGIEIRMFMCVGVRDFFIRFLDSEDIDFVLYS